MRSRYDFGGVSALALLLCALCVPSTAAALPNHFMQEGLVTDAQGLPFEGPHKVTLRLYAQAAGGAAFFEEVQNNVPFWEGYYAVEIGAVAPLNGLDFLRPEVYLGMTLDDGVELAPRIRFSKVPSAFVADVALDVTGAINPQSVSIGGQVIIDEQGRWQGDPVGLRGPPGGDGSPDTPEQILAKIVIVDGARSGLDADLLDGLHAAAFVPALGNATITGTLGVSQSVTVNGAVNAGGVRLNDLPGQSYLTLDRADASTEMGLRYRTGGAVDWRGFVDNNAADNNLRWVSAVNGYGDRSPQLQLSALGDLDVGRNIFAGGVMGAAGLLVRGDARVAPILRVRPTAAMGAEQGAVVIEGADGAPRISLEPQGGGNKGAISGSSTGLDVTGGLANAGALRLRSSHNPNGSEVTLQGNRVDIKSLSGGGQSEPYLSVVGPTGRVGVAQSNPGAQLHVQGLGNQIVQRQERAGGTSYDQNVEGGRWSLNQTGQPALITADGPNTRVIIPSLVIPAMVRAPANPVRGQIYNSEADDALFIWDGAAWVPIGGVDGGGGGGAADVPRVVQGFAGTQGPDLTPEGYSQCYGWANDGATRAPSVAALRQACGAGQDMVFAGHRCDGSYVRHNAKLIAPFMDFLAADRQRVWRDFDIAGQFSWHMSPDWALLTRFNNAWSDPGRLWEPYIGGVAANVGPAYGHVLSQTGNDAHDVRLCLGDKYYIYLKAAAAVPPEVVALGLVGHWPLDGDGIDVSGRGLNGSVEGGMPFAAGRRDQAARVDGLDDGVRVADGGNSPLDVSAVTMAAWIYPQSCGHAGAGHGIIMNKESAFEVALEAGCHLQAAFAPGCWRWWGTEIIPINSWTHIAVVQNGQQQIHYVNGERVELTACAGLLVSNDSDFKIGARGGDGVNTSSFDGLIDEAFLYDRALGDAEINLLYTSGSLVVDAEALGGVNNPALSCFAIKQANAASTSGTYMLDTDGVGPRQPFMAFCEQLHQGGGWTLLNNHEAAAGYFGNNAQALNMNAGNPEAPIYSVLGKVEEFVRGNRYELLYWNRQGGQWVINTQTSSPLDPLRVFACAVGNQLVNANYAPGLFCGYTPGPNTWSAINGYGPNWTHAVGQFKIYAAWPLVCTHNTNYQCNHYQFYVR
jgi:hypothetical protein